MKIAMNPRYFLVLLFLLQGNKVASSAISKYSSWKLGCFLKALSTKAITSLAEWFSNFVLAFVVALPWKYLGDFMPDAVLLLLQMTFHTSIFLGLFNLFPFPPLDGSKILGLFIPKRWYSAYENYLENGVKYFVAIILVDVFILGDLLGYSIFGYVIRYLHEKVSMILLLGTWCSAILKFPTLYIVGQIKG